MSPRLLITAAITGLVLALPGAATALADPPAGVPAAGDACDPAVDMEYAADAQGRDLACGPDGTWALVDAGEEPGGSDAPEDPAAPEPEPDAPSAADDPAADLDGTPCDAADDAPEGWECAPVYTEDCEVTGHAYRAVKDDGTLDVPAEQAAWEQECGGAEPSASASQRPPGTMPEEVPGDEAPGTACGKPTEGDTSGGYICVCLDGDHGWYHAGSWYFYEEVWYWWHDDSYWYLLDGAWSRADGAVANGIDDARSAPSRSPAGARPAADKSVYLPLTGASLAGFAAAALALAGAGGTAWWFARRRRSRTEA